ncbi:MAG TPA: nodulation protein NfeD [Myxococcota bacterium]
MRGGIRAAIVGAALLWLLPALATAAHVNVVVIDGSINPASSDHIQLAISQSEKDGAEAVLIELDTPGGLLSATKDIVQSMLNARVPVIVFVSPQGAWAASAGAFVTLAGHVAAMAPGTSIGAASPVSVTGGGGERDEDDQRQDVGMEKAEKFTAAFIESIAKERKRNVEWAGRAVRESEAITQDEALKLGVIDLVAQDRDDLFAQLEGREVVVAGEPRELRLAGADIRVIEMRPLTRLFNVLASPDIAVLLVMAGMLGLYVEFNQPGMLFPGIAGAVCLILAAIAFQILPFSWVGLLVMLLGVGLMIAEIFVTSFGVLFATGLACMLLGGSMLFEMPEVSDLSVSFWSVLVPLVLAFGLIGGLVVLAVSRSLLSAQTAGVDELVGLVGKAISDLVPDGTIFVRGEYWNATAEETIERGQPVQITAVEGLRVRVRRPRPES